MHRGISIKSAFLILLSFREYAMQLSDIVARLQHMLARRSIPMVHV
jgi:hypothetical protein